MQGHRFSSISVLVAVVAFFGAAPARVEPKKAYYADVAIVIDSKPALQSGITLPSISHSNQGMRFRLVHAIIESIFKRPELDFRVAVFASDGPDTTELLSFKEGVKKDGIQAKIEGPMLRLPLKDSQTTFVDTITIAKNTIQKSDGNRPGVPDLIIWSMIYEIVAEDFDHKLIPRVYQEANGGVDVVVFFLLGGNLLDSVLWLSCRRTTEMCFFMAYSEIPTKNKTIYPLLNYHSEYSFEPGRLADFPDRLIAMLGQCTADSSDSGPCHFTAERACVVNKTYKPPTQIAEHLKKYCVTGQRVFDCDRTECDRRCDQETDHEERPCNASCDGQGWMQYRPKKASTDPFFQYCPWKLKPCPGQPCRQTTTTSRETIETTPTTTTTSRKTIETTPTTTSTAEKTVETVPMTTTTLTTSSRRKTTRKRPTAPPVVPTPRPAPAATESTESVETSTSASSAAAMMTMASADGSQLEAWEIVLIVIASLAFIALIILIVVFVVNRKRKRQRPRHVARKHGHRAHGHRRGGSPRGWDRGRAGGSPRNRPRMSLRDRHIATRGRPIERSHRPESPEHRRKGGYSPRPLCAKSSSISPGVRMVKAMAASASQSKPSIIGGAWPPRKDYALDVGASISTRRLSSPTSKPPTSRPSETARPSTRPSSSRPSARPSSSKHGSSSKITSRTPRPQATLSSLPTTSPSTSAGTVRPFTKSREVVRPKLSSRLKKAR